MTHSVQILIHFSHHRLLNGDTYLTFLGAHFSPLKAIIFPSISCANASSLTHPLSFTTSIHSLLISPACPRVKYKPFAAAATIKLVKALGVAMYQEHNDQHQIRLYQDLCLVTHLQSSVNNNWGGDFSEEKS